MTAQERRIARELGWLYLALFIVAGACYMATDFGSIPQWITAGIAVAAGGIAVWSIWTQREIARKRAALDLFLRSEMDKSIAEKFEEYDDHITTLKNNAGMPIKDFEAKFKKEYRGIVHCLNIHELVAVGIYKDVLDAHVCYEFWGDSCLVHTATQYG